MKTLTITLSDRTYNQVVAILQHRHARNPFPENFFVHNLNSLAEALFTEFVDEEIPLPPQHASIGMLYQELAKYGDRLQMLQKVIRQLDAISVPNFDESEMIRYDTKRLVVRLVRVQYAVNQISRAIAEHPDHDPIRTWLFSSEAFVLDFEPLEFDEADLDEAQFATAARGES